MTGVYDVVKWRALDEIFAGACARARCGMPPARMLLESGMK
jgi:hypothetical protein